MKIIKPVPITGLPTGVNGAHLWWCVNATANNGDSFYVAVEQITMASSVGGPNLCVGGVASTDHPKDGYPASNAFDTGSYTACVLSQPTGRIIYRFLNPVNIVEFKIKSRTDGYATQAIKDGDLQYSDDGIKWVNAGPIVNQTAWSAAETRTFQAALPNQITTSTLTEDDYAVWNSGTAYVAGNRCIRTTTHKIYECLVNNTNNIPENNVTGATPKWLEVSATNMYKAFDAKIADQTMALDSFSYTLTTGLIDAVALLNLDATSVQITMTDPIEGVVYDRTFSLIGTANVIDAYSYCFGPILKRTDLAVMDLPPYVNASVTITVNNPNSTAKVGEIVVGQQSYIGGTEYGLSVSDIDYSGKTQDTFGNWSVVERSFSNRINCNLLVDNAFVDEVKRLLSLYRAKPVVWVSVEDLAMGIVYGYRKSFEITIPLPDNSECSLEIEGLV